MITNLEAITDLRKQINEKPEDYTIRLIYADALEETNAEFLIECARKIRNRVWFRKHFDRNGIMALKEGALRAVAGRSFDETVDFYGESRVLPLTEIVFCEMNLWLNHGPDLVREYPIQRVRITDRDSTASSIHNDYCAWYNDSFYNLGESDEIAACVFPFLMKNDDDYASYPSRRKANLDLSQACIRWAKSISKADSVS